MIELERSVKRDMDASAVLRDVLGEDFNPHDLEAERLVRCILEDDRYVVCRYKDGDTNGLAMRLNKIWFYPLFIITIPIQWLIRGKVGVSRDSKIGRIIEKLIGF